MIDSENYEIIGEISQNIINNSRQKISQEFNYIHLIKEFNKYAKKEDSNFISLCNEYGFNNNEKIFILITDGSYIRTKYLINVLINKKSEIEKLISQKKEKTEIINVLSGYFNDNSTLDLLEINIERFYNFCLFYYNLKESGIKFCFCFISDIIEDKLENILEEKIKLYKDYDKDFEKKIDLKDESEKKKPKNEFIEKIAETLEKNNKLKSNLMIISNKINRKIKDFVDKKNVILKKLDDFFIKFNKKNDDTFFDISTMLIKDMKEQDLFIKNIYLNKMAFFFIFLLPKENIIKLNKIKDNIRNIEKGLTFEIIQNEDMNEIEDYIQLQNRDKVKIKIFISNNEKKINYIATKNINKNNYFYYVLKEKFNIINLSDIIQKNFASALNLFIDDFYENKKCYLPNVKENKEILSKQNILEKIKYDMTLLKIKYETIDNIPNSVSFQFKEDNEDNKELVSIIQEYYDSLVNMIKDLLDTSKIKNNNSVMNYFVDKHNFFGVFNNLIENLKCKCFYRYFLFNYIKSNILLHFQINMEKIGLDEIMEN